MSASIVSSIDPALGPGLSRIYEMGALVSFMLLAIIVLLIAVKALYNRNLAMGDMFMKALADNTASNHALAQQIERWRNDK
jgi:hypothetical protein